MGDKITDIEKLFSINHIKEGQKLLLVDCPKEIFSYCKKFQPAKLVGCYIDSAECKEMADEYEVITLANSYGYMEEPFDMLIIYLNSKNISELKMYIKRLSMILCKSGRVVIFYEFNDMEVECLTNYDVDTVVHDLIYGYFMTTSRCRIDNGYVVSAIKLSR